MKDQKSLTSRMLTREQAAVYLNIPTSTLYKMVSRREIPYVKHNANLYFDKELLDQWLKEKTTMPMYLLIPNKCNGSIVSTTSRVFI